MKRFLTIVLLLAMITTTACSANSNIDDKATTATEATKSVAVADDVKDKEAIKNDIEACLKEYDFQGIVFLTKNGEVLYQSATGVSEAKEPLAIDSLMPVGSVSKQFCATAILMLREQGKLSVDDALGKYFPEYEIGKDVTLKDLLNMKSGIRDMVNEGWVEEISTDNSEEANTEVIKRWIFNQELAFDPGSTMSYSNSNYFLLSNIVEQVSGQKYVDFLRENIFKPLGMNNTGSIEEVSDSPDWAKGVTFDSVEDGKMRGLTKGSGDIVTTAYDMDLWLTGLRGGKLISSESYKEMTTNYTDQLSNQYGYGIRPGMFGGVWHPGGIGMYFAMDYTNAEQGYNLFVASNHNISSAKMETLPMDLLKACLGKNI